MVEIKIDKIIVFIFFLLAFVVFMSGLRTFWIGFHNTDLCANQMVMSEMYDLDIKETKLDGETWGLRECYLDGLGRIIKGFYISVLGMFLIGITAGILFLKD